MLKRPDGTIIPVHRASTALEHPGPTDPLRQSFTPKRAAMGRLPPSQQSRPGRESRDGQASTSDRPFMEPPNGSFATTSRGLFDESPGGTAGEVSGEAAVEASRQVFSILPLLGRLTEVTAHRNTPWLTLLCRLLLDTQSHEEPAIWVASIPEKVFYPPDFQKNGVNLSLLPVVFAPDNQGAGRATEKLLRSGTFALIIVEVQAPVLLPDAIMGRMVTLAAKSRTAVVLVSHHPDTQPNWDAGNQGRSAQSRSSGGETPEVAQHGDAVRNGNRASSGNPVTHGNVVRRGNSVQRGTGGISGAASLVSVRLEPQWAEINAAAMAADTVVTKDKRLGPGRRYREVCNGVPGLC